MAPRDEHLRAYLAALGSYGLSSMDVDNIDVFLANCSKAADAAIAYADKYELPSTARPMAVDEPNGNLAASATNGIGG